MPEQKTDGSRIATTPTPADQSSVLQRSIVQYTYGSAVSEQKYGLLEWTADNHIRLTQIDTDSKKLIQQVCDYLPSQIHKVVTSITYLTLHVEGGPLTLSFSETAMAWQALGGYGLFEAYDKTQQSGIGWWIESFRNHQVEVTDLNVLGGKNSGLIIGLLVGGVVVISFIVLLLGAVT